MATDPQKNEEKPEIQPEGQAQQEASPAAELEAKLLEEKNKYLYLYAEFENFRRRNERDRIDFLKFGHERFLKELLLVLDNFERAIAQGKASGAEQAGPLGGVMQGVEMIHFQLLDTLKSQGVSEIKTQGTKFDPALHEAVGEEESELESGTIVKEHLKGYRLHDRLLRAAKVTVAKGKN